MSALARKKGPPDLAIILGTHKPEDDGEEHEDGGADGGEKDAMEAFIEAVHDKDTGAALEAFAALHDMHAAKQDDDEAEEDEEKD